MKTSILLLLIFLAGSKLAAGQYCYPATNHLHASHQIQYFQIGGFINITPDTNIQEYNDFSDSLIINVELGQDYYLLMSKEPDPFGFIVGNTLGYTIWVDFDNDTILSASEVIYSEYDGSGVYTYEDTLHFPDSLPCGKHRLRVRNEWGDLPDSPCDILWGGETEDYTINLLTRRAISPTACGSYASPSGNFIWTSSGTYSDTLVNVAGCDTVFDINLTINEVDSAVTQSGDTLMANAMGASYQWLVCDNGYSTISGATGQIYSPPATGNYAVEVTQNGCTDTSSCSLIVTGIPENHFGAVLNIFPNPTTGKLTIDVGNTVENIAVKVSNVVGQVVSNENVGATGAVSIDIAGPTGVYFVTIESADGKHAVLKVLKE